MIDKDKIDKYFEGADNEALVVKALGDTKSSLEVNIEWMERNNEDRQLVSDMRMRVTEIDNIIKFMVSKQWEKLQANG